MNNPSKMFLCYSCSVKFKICIDVSFSMIKSNPQSFSSSILFSKFKMVSHGPSSIFPSYSVISSSSEYLSSKSSEFNAPNILAQFLIYNYPIFLLNRFSCTLHFSSSNPSSTCNMFITFSGSTSTSISNPLQTYMTAFSTSTIVPILMKKSNPRSKS